MSRASLSVAVLSLCAQAHAGRPLVTDDAGVVGEEVLQFEAWGRFHTDSLQAWLTLALGPWDPLELSITVMHANRGAVGPSAQVKFRFAELEPAGWPGLAAALGVLAPLRGGPLAPAVWGPYGYLALTWSPLASDRMALHANVGVASRDIEGPALTWGAAASMQVVGPFHAFVEYAGGVAHGGLVWELGKDFQIDATIGGVPLFGTVGLKWAPRVF